MLAYKYYAKLLARIVYYPSLKTRLLCKKTSSQNNFNQFTLGGHNLYN